uniref:Uncharacterized protein n=1 Tax=Panagrellus redivivus TaxID=6233 RepID=A0A7E4V5J3_PANRE
MREENAAYYNLGTTCPLGTCTLMIHPRTAFYLFVKSSEDTVDAQFHDEFSRVCPRKVINNRQNFTILELPDCPVIMNNATLPKTTTKNNTTLAIGIIAGCAIVIIMLLIIIIVGYCIYKRLKR